MQMKSFLSVAGVVTFVIAAASSLGAVTLPPSGSSHYTANQVKQMIREAHTADQYRAVAHYFEQRHSDFSQMAADQMEEVQRRAQNTSGPAAKWPRPVDVARNLYDYYAHEADDAAFQADKYYRFALGAEALNK